MKCIEVGYLVSRLGAESQPQLDSHETGSILCTRFHPAFILEGTCFCSKHYGKNWK